MYEYILFDSGDGTATITLNRPEKLNAYIPEMGEEVAEAFDRIREDDSIRAAILTGAGRGFCAGVDLGALKAQQEGKPNTGKGPKLGEERFLRKLPLELIEFPKPVIVAINGPAIGVGMTMALPCDIRIAADTAKLGLTFTKLGIIPGLGGTHLLPKIVGMGRAQELVLTARVILAPEALEMGLVNRVVPADQLMKTAREMAAMVAECKPDAVALAKRALHYGARSTMEEAMRNEQAASAEMAAARQKASG